MIEWIEKAYSIYIYMESAANDGEYFHKGSEACVKTKAVIGSQSLLELGKDV